MNSKSVALLSMIAIGFCAGCRSTNSSVRQYGLSPDINQQVASLSRRVGVESRAADADQSRVQPVTFEQEAKSNPNIAPASPQTQVNDLEITGQDQTKQTIPIDLPTVLQMVGSDNWNVQLAREKVCEARARWQKARLMWLPNLRLALGYTGHEGEIQETGGNVVSVSRRSLFVGGGAGLGNAPLAGGAGGPARMFVNLSTADILFEPLAKKHLLNATQAKSDTVFNNTLLAAALAYYELIEAEAGQVIAQQNLDEANTLANLIQSFVKAGKGSPADVSRAQIIQRRRQQELAIATGAVGAAQAKLLEIIQSQNADCGFNVIFTPTDSTPLTVQLVDSSVGLDSLIQQGLALRPELRTARANLAAQKSYCTSERWRPLLPYLTVGSSAGGFGGGQGSNFPTFNGRADLDVVMAWEVENAGFGTVARRKAQASRVRQSELALAAMKNKVTAEVATAYHRATALEKSLAVAAQALAHAESSFTKDTARIRALEGMPLELVQAINALADARKNYLSTVVGFNQGQLRLLNAIGGVDQAK